MPFDLALVDTNVLVYAMFPESEHHLPSRKAIEQAQGEEVRLCLTPQIYSEFYAIMTNPRRVSQPRSPIEALEALDRIVELPGMALLPIPLDILDRMKSLLQKYPVKGNGIFDIQLVATMLGNGVNKLFTFNREHFERISEIKIVEI
jgi:predicted nucleic acid-binding protein